MQKTNSKNQSQGSRVKGQGLLTEHTIDAKNENLGRLATKIADILQGKDDPNYQPNKVANNKVIVKNIDKVKVSGKKYDQKIYYKHTGYIGHLKKIIYKDLFSKSPEKVLERAVKGMLPKNKLRDRRMKNLIIETSTNPSTELRTSNE